MFLGCLCIHSSHSCEMRFNLRCSNSSIFCVAGFGATVSDESSSKQNGYPQNRYLKEAHQTLDNNLGKNNFTKHHIVTPKFL